MNAEAIHCRSISGIKHSNENKQRPDSQRWHAHAEHLPSSLLSSLRGWIVWIFTKRGTCRSRLLTAPSLALKHGALPQWKWHAYFHGFVYVYLARQEPLKIHHHVGGSQGGQWQPNWHRVTAVSWWQSVELNYPWGLIDPRPATSKVRVPAQSTIFVPGTLTERYD